ncbi:YceI family protein [Candidatus Marithrix sp. Canyon 246]|uniref:YceI family protein n=1 Tax=Candidatus Marithrix sp. Canyon 246 TaxID=1827136 RepID=UPI00084A2BBE|nr:YceI family protein [Candidatus Marithrix sp. Canyon 246]
MIKKLSLLLFSIAFISSCISSNKQSDYQLDNDTSSLTFISVKKTDTAEIGKFKQLEGTIDKSGNVTLKVDLSSVDTNIAIRNSRMQEFLFEIAKFATANITTKVDMEKVNKLAIGKTMLETVTIKLDLHGEQKDITANVLATRLAEDKLMIVNQTALFLKAADFKLLDGIEKLRNLVGLPRISKVVPINFVFTFKM